VTRPSTRSRQVLDEVLSEFTREELAFLRLHAIHGPVIRASIAANVLGFRGIAELRDSVRRGTTPLDVFRPPTRRQFFVNTIDLAKYMEARGGSIPPQPIPERWSFSKDDTSGSEIFVLGQPMAATEFRSMTLTRLTALRLHARYGPLVPSSKAAELLFYRDSQALIQAVHLGRERMGLVIPFGRNKSFASTRDVARLLCEMAQAPELAPKADNGAQD